MNRVTIGGSEKKKNELAVLVDGIPIEGVTASRYSKKQAGEKPYFAFFRGEQILAISSVSIKDLLNSMNSVHIDLDLDQPEDGWISATLRIDGDKRAIKRKKNVILEVQYDMELWSRSYSIVDLTSGLDDLLTKQTTSDSFWPSDDYWPEDDRGDSILNGFGIESFIDPSTTVGELVRDYPVKLQELLDTVEINLLEKSEDSVVRIFEFPESMRSACEASTIMCGWAKTGVVGDSIVILNFTKPDYFEKERDPQPRITMTPAPGIADDAYYITSQFGTSLIIKKGSTVISFAIRDKSIPSVQLMEKERALGLKAAARL